MVRRLTFLYFLIAPFIYYVRIATSNVTLFLLDGLLLLILFFIGRTIQKKHGRFPRRLYPILSLWLIYVVLAALESLNPHTESLASGLMGFRAHILAIGFVFVPAYAFRSKNDIRRFLLLMAGTAVIVALVGIRQRFIGYNSIEAAWLQTLPQLQQRVFSTMGAAHLFGTYMAVVMVVLLTTWSVWSKWGKVMVAAVTILCVAGLLASQMRAPIFGVIIGLFVASVLLDRRFSAPRLLVRLGSFATVALLICGLLWSVALQVSQKETPTGNLLRSLMQGSERISLLLQVGFQDPSAQARWENMQNTLRSAWSNPLGDGLGVYQSVDDYYVVILGEMGWVGLLLFVGLILLLAFSGLSAYRSLSDPYLQQAAKAWLGACTVFLFGSISASLLATPMFASYFWLFFGWIVSLPQVEQRARFEPTTERLPHSRGGEPSSARRMQRRLSLPVAST